MLSNRVRSRQLNRVACRCILVLRNALRRCVSGCFIHRIQPVWLLVDQPPFPAMPALMEEAGPVLLAFAVHQLEVGGGAGFDCLMHLHPAVRCSI